MLVPCGPSHCAGTLEPFCSRHPIRWQSVCAIWGPCLEVISQLTHQDEVISYCPFCHRRRSTVCRAWTRQSTVSTSSLRRLTTRTAANAIPRNALQRRAPNGSTGTSLRFLTLIGHHGDEGLHPSASVLLYTTPPQTPLCVGCFVSLIVLSIPSIQSGKGWNPPITGGGSAVQEGFVTL